MWGKGVRGLSHPTWSPGCLLTPFTICVSSQSSCSSPSDPERLPSLPRRLHTNKLLHLTFPQFGAQPLHSITTNPILSYQASRLSSPWCSLIEGQTRFFSHDHLAHHHHPLCLRHPPCCSDPECYQRSCGHLYPGKWTLSGLEQLDASSWLPRSL